MINFNVGVRKIGRGSGFLGCLKDDYKNEKKNTMLPSLTVLHVVLFSFFASFSYSMGVPELDNTKSILSYKEVVTLNANTLNVPEDTYKVENGTISISSDVTGAYCDLDNGTITVNVVGGLDPDYEFQIQPQVGAPSPWQDSNFFDNLGIEDYLIVVRRKSDNTCWGTNTAQIADASDLEIISFDFLCQEGVNTADFTMLVTGGTAEYTLSFQQPGGGTYTTSSFDSTIPFQIAEIVEGNYTIFVEDRLGCVKDTTFFVEECCTFRYECLTQPIVLQCMDELPAIDSIYTDGITTGSSDLDSLEAQNILSISANCYDAIVSVEDINANMPTDCVNDTLKINRTYTIDQNGILYTCVQEYNVLSFQDSSLDAEAEDINLECSVDGSIQTQIDTWLANNGNAVITSCGNNPQWANDYVLGSEQNGCANTGSIEVTFTFTDDCDTEIITTASINVVDNINPDISCIGDLVLDCGFDQTQIDDWLMNNASGSDLCSEPVITHDFQGFMPDCGQSGQVLVTFTATDECGLTSTCTSNLIVTDPNAYEVNCPENLEVDLDDPNLLATINAWLELASTEDPCYDVDFPITNDFDPNDLNVQCDYLSLTVIFSATNDCGIEKSCNAQIVASQNIGGTVNCPEPITVQCGDPNNEDIIAAWLQTASAEDHEGNNIPLTSNYTMVDTQCGTTEILFSGVDNCGQDVNCGSMIIVEDSTGPVMTCPEDLNLSCGEDMASINAWLSSISATDECGVGFITDNFNDVDFTLTCGESGHFEVTFTATDICGNESECVGRINIFDDSNIGINCPTNLILDDSVVDIDAAVQEWLATAEVVDPCDLGLQITNNYGTESITFDCGFIMGEVTFEIASTCGSVASCTATISGNVDVTPTIDCPEDITMVCGDATNDASINNWVTSVTAQDFAGFDLEVVNDLPEDLGSLCGVIEVVFTTKDECDNNLSCVHTITIEDNEAPQIVCAPERAIDLSIGSAQSQINEIIANTGLLDNCSEVELEYSFDEDISTLGCGDVETMTLTATDACGNVTVCETEVSFIDYNEIYIDCPDPLSISCLEPDLEGYIFDYLESVNVQTSRLDAELSYDYDPDLVSDACNDYITFDVTYIAVDDCGNEKTCVVPIEILPEMKVFVPNIFTPDGDGLNDLVTVYANKNVNIIKEWYIFDRWGEAVYRGYDFSPNSEQDGWDGFFKGRLAEVNVYSYILTVVDDFGRENTSTGTITLMK